MMNQLRPRTFGYRGRSRLDMEDEGETAEPMIAESSADAFFVTSAGQGEIRNVPLPPPGPEDAVIRCLYSGISRGTETLVFRGRVPQSQYQAMRAPFQEGDFSAPVKYGYAAVGLVESGPPGLRDRPVFCLHPHQTRFVVPAVSVVRLPDGVPPARAVLAANMETAVNALWDAKPMIGDRVAVIGAGVVGCLVAYLARRMPGTTVQVIDTDDTRSSLVNALGCDFKTPGEATGDADLVLEASGSPAGADLALRLARFEGTVVVLSWFGDEPVPLPLGEDFHARRLTIRSSQVGSVSPARRLTGWNNSRRLEFALSLLTNPVLDGLISGESDFADLPRTMRWLAAAPAGVLCHRIRYSARSSD